MRFSIILALTFVSTALGCDGFTTVKGRVVDQTGNPIHQAEVKLIYKPDDARYRRTSTASTDKDGRFAVGIVHSPSKKLPIQLEVGKTGFAEHVEKLTSMASYQKEITLRAPKE